MANYTRIEVASAMKTTGLVPLFYNDNLDINKQIIKACHEGGARLFEFTARGDFAHEIYGELSKYVSSELPGMILGVGSVTDAASASLYMAMGANFIVTPVFREDIATVCNRRKVLWSPGCGTLSEIARAEELGCEIVKLFPADSFTPAFVKAIKGPQPWTNIMPTGGVKPTKESLEPWFRAGVTCVGLGSQLMKTNEDGSYDFDEIKNKVSDVLELIEQFKN